MPFFNLFGKKDQSGITPGLEVELEISTGRERDVFVVEVISVDQKTVTLTPPHDLSDIAKFSLGLEISAHAEVGEKIGSFKASVVSIEKRPPAIVISRPEKVEWREKTQQEQQRRNFVRFAAALPLAYSPAKGVDREATTIDISGNGLSMMADAPIPIGRDVAIRLKLPEKEIRCVGRVVRSIPYAKTGAAKGKQEVAMSFVDIELKDQDLIVRHIFERQRQLRRRGLM